MQGAQVQSLVRKLDPTCHNYDPKCHSSDSLHATAKIKDLVCFRLGKRKKSVDGGLNLILGKEKGTDLGLPGKLGTVIVVVQLLSVSDSMRPHELQHPSLPRPSQSPGVCSNSCLLSR